MEEFEKLAQINSVISDLSNMGVNIGESERLQAINLLSEYSKILSE